MQCMWKTCFFMWKNCPEIVKKAWKSQPLRNKNEAFTEPVNSDVSSGFVFVRSGVRHAAGQEEPCVE